MARRTLKRAGNRTVHYPVGQGPPILTEDWSQPRDPKETLAYRLDHALMRGGEIADIGRTLRVPPSAIRRHIAARARTTRWKFIATRREWQVLKGKRRLVIVAGRLYRLTQ